MTEFDLAADGDPLSRQMLFVEHYDAVRAFIETRIRRDDIGWINADDVLQQTFVRAFKAVDSFEWHGRQSLGGWLKTIATNLIKDALKRRGRERLAPKPVSPDAAHRPASVAKLEANVPTASHDFRQTERADAVRSALALLSEDQHQVVMMRYLQHLTVKEVAEHMGRSEDSVHALLQRAIRKMRQFLGSASLFFSSE